MACKTQLPDLPLSLAILWVSQTYEIKFVFLLVILSYVNVVIKPVKETQRLEGKFSSPITQRNSVFLFLFLKNMTFFFFLFWLAHSIRCSWARVQIWATAVTQAIAAATPDPWPTVQGRGSNLCLSAPKMLLNPLCHRGNSKILCSIK